MLIIAGHCGIIAQPRIGNPPSEPRPGERGVFATNADRQRIEMRGRFYKERKKAGTASAIPAFMD